MLADRCAQGHEWQTPGSNVLAGTTAKRQSSLKQGTPDGLRRLQQ